MNYFLFSALEGKEQHQPEQQEKVASTEICMWTLLAYYDTLFCTGASLIPRGTAKRGWWYCTPNFGVATNLLVLLAMLYCCQELDLRNAYFCQQIVCTSQNLFLALPLLS